MDTVLRLLKPVEYRWKELAYNLLKDELIFNVNTIETNCFQRNDAKVALTEVLKEWHTKRTVQTWQTLNNAAKKTGDVSLEKYMQKNGLESKFQYVNGLMKKN